MRDETILLPIPIPAPRRGDLDDLIFQEEGWLVSGRFRAVPAGPAFSRRPAATPFTFSAASYIIAGNRKESVGHLCSNLTNIR